MIPTRFLLALFLLSSNFIHAYTVRENLNSVGSSVSWQVNEFGQTEKFKAKIPGTIHTDLLAAGKIPDPFFGYNDSLVRWVGEKTWEYTCSFMPSEKIWKTHKKELVFEGLDTYADVYLNGKLILRADNMFCTWRVQVSKLLKRNDNTLRIVF
ncbi:MAG: glycosyl hydrolase 2 galactose-binding domain-containing protein, partial [Bacteroidia bacterium]